MNTSQSSRTVTADTKEELNQKVEDLVEQGWQSDGAVVENPDGTFSQKMIRQ